MKKVIIALILSTFAFLNLSGCSKTAEQSSEVKEFKQIEVDPTIPSEPLVKKLVAEVVEKSEINDKTIAKITEFSGIEVGTEPKLETLCLTVFGVYQCNEVTRYYFNCKFKVNCLDKSTNKILASVGHEIKEGELVVNKVGRLELRGYGIYDHLCQNYSNESLIKTQDNSIIGTDKPVYNYGEQIKIKYSNAPGDSKDWICIVPAGSRDREAGDWKYIPTSGNGVLTFDSPQPGDYEARAFYRYKTEQYNITARYYFKVK